MTRAAQLDVFVGWLQGSATQADLGGGTGRTFRHEHAWCWNVDPVIPVTGEVYDEVQVDGTYLSGGSCRLIAVDGATGTMIAWQWCDTEKTPAWVALLERLTRQDVLFTYLREDLDALTISATTNRIEGGVNHPIKDLLRRHRGMSDDHRRRATEWYCHQHSPAPPATLIRPEHYKPAPTTTVIRG